MAVRFKFRSSAAFDAADLGGLPAISVRDLRAKIISQKHLQLCPDNDLVLSDALTGQVFEDEELMIPEGASVVIKRVPAERSLHVSLAGNVNAGCSAVREVGFVPGCVPTEDVDVENFDDFGIDLNPILEESFRESDDEVSSSKTIMEKADVVPRCQIFDSSDISEAMSKGIVEKCKRELGNEEDTKLIKMKLKENISKAEPRCTPIPTTVNPDLPTELICSLCSTIIKEAVMIPCCQYSFCEKCIRFSLLERARCPKCSSLKCKVQDFRQAIEHFLDAQVAGADNVMVNVPDGESGIQEKEASCAVPTRQKDLACSYSPFATGIGSNQDMAESAFENTMNVGIGSHSNAPDTSKPVKLPPSSLKAKQVEGIETSPGEALKQKTGIESANLTTQKKKAPSVVPFDGSGVPKPPMMYRKGDRTCYRCGSPSHIVRFCPVASNQYPLMPTGDAAFSGGMPAYGQGYWHGASVPHMSPYASMFASPGFIPYDPAMVPVSPFGVPSYMPSLYAGMPGPYGFMRMGSVPPTMITGAERPLTRAEFMELQEDERNQKPWSDYQDREVGYDNISDDGNRRKLHEQRDLANTISCSDSDSQIRYKKRSHDRGYSSHQRPDYMSDEEIYSVDAKQEKRSHVSVSGRDDRAYYSKKSDNPSDSSQRSREKKRHHRKNRSDKLDDEKLLSNAESSRAGRHRHRREKSGDKEKVRNDNKRHSRKHRSSPESDHSSYQKQLHKESDSVRDSRHSTEKVKATNERLEDDRWEMGDGLGEDYRGQHYHQKRKRTH